ncbi:MAG: acyltransferase, partial [Clostridia bacterium]|nr:acyltransferase [Clostridia bacterium]
MTDVVKNNKPVVRNEGIDLLRIISMFMVVLLHVLGVGGLLKAANDAPIGYEALRVLQIGATCAVNCYGLISGYVGYKGKFKLSSIALMWLQVFLISV